MASEYILFQKPELTDLEKTFLTAQLSTLTSLKNLRIYKKSRADEFQSKIKIKTLLGEAANELTILDRLLPQSQFKTHEVQENGKENNLLFPEMEDDEPKRLSLEDELEKLKRRISLLG